MTDRVRKRIPDSGGVSRKGTVAMLFTVEARNAEESGVYLKPNVCANLVNTG